MMMKTLLFSVILTLVSYEAIAADSIKPGTYVTEGAWGNLEVSSSSADSPMKFTIDVVGGNGHICNVEGEIRNNQAITEDKCVIQFEGHSDRVSVTVGKGFTDACREYCGARAWFPGDYFPVNPFCSKSLSIRGDFSLNYKSGKYRKARDLLMKLLSECERFTDWHIQAEIRNDLAITEYHLGDKTACLKALEPIKRTFIDDPAKTYIVFDPVEGDWATGMVKTTRFNWQKCGGVLPVYSDTNK